MCIRDRTGNVERPAQQNTETANPSAMSANMPPKKKNGFKETAKAAEQGNTEERTFSGRSERSSPCRAFGSEVRGYTDRL